MEYQSHVDLTPYNTFGVGVKANQFTVVRTLQDLQHLIQAGAFKDTVLVLGGGSNLLFTKDYPGLVVKIEILGKQVVFENDDELHLKTGAGENWHSLVLHCVGQGWGGIENLSLIPGTVGAAPIQNIGAYGRELKDVLHEVEAVDVRTAEIRVFSNQECEFGYRESVFKQKMKGRYIISSVTLRLSKRNHNFNVTYGAIQDTLIALGYSKSSLQAISDAVIHIRKTKLPDPAVIGNAGSFFKNPSVSNDAYQVLKNKHPNLPAYPNDSSSTKIPAAWLIEQCGWKGKTFGQIGVHQQQALVLVNYGGGKGEDIWQLAMKIQSSVQEKFGILLQPEVNVQ